MDVFCCVSPQNHFTSWFIAVVAVKLMLQKGRCPRHCSVTSHLGDRSLLTVHCIDEYRWCSLVAVMYDIINWFQTSLLTHAPAVWKWLVMCGEGAQICWMSTTAKPVTHSNNRYQTTPQILITVFFRNVFSAFFPVISCFLSLNELDIAAMFCLNSLHETIFVTADAILTWSHLHLFTLQFLNILF